MITLIMPFYRNCEMLKIHYRNWASWPENLKEKYNIIIVDDGSPEPAVDVPRLYDLPSLSIYRVLEDRLWHQHAARNLGAHVANDGWLLLTDMDHLLTEENAYALSKRVRVLNENIFYMLNRVEVTTGKQTTTVDGNPKPHPNSFVMTRDLYWKIGGYDEDFCGIYGTDGLFKARAMKVASKGFLNKVSLIRYWRDIVPDASTVGIPRKEGREVGARERIFAEKAMCGDPNSVKVLQFPWEQVL